MMVAGPGLWPGPATSLGELFNLYLYTPNNNENEEERDTVRPGPNWEQGKDQNLHSDPMDALSEAVIKLLVQSGIEAGIDFDQELLIKSTVNITNFIAMRDIMEELNVDSTE